MRDKVEVLIFTNGCALEDKTRYENDLIVALTRFGYTPHVSIDNDAISFIVDEDDSIINITEDEYLWLK